MTRLMALAALKQAFTTDVSPILAVARVDVQAAGLLIQSGHTAPAATGSTRLRSVRQHRAQPRPGLFEDKQVSNQQSAISSQQSAISNQQSAVSSQQSAVSSQQSAVSSQQSAVSSQQSAVSNQNSVAKVVCDQCGQSLGVMDEAVQLPQLW